LWDQPQAWRRKKRKKDKDRKILKKCERKKQEKPFLKFVREWRDRENERKREREKESAKD